MRPVERRRACATVVLAAGLAAATGLLAQDRPIGVVDTDPAPARIEGGTYFFVGGLVSSMVRNRHTAPVRVTLRAWVFDQAGRFKGTNAYCVPEWLERGTRRVISASLDVRDLAATDSVTVGVERVASERQEWTMADAPAIGVELARQRGRGAGGRARLHERPIDGPSEVGCPCECQSIAAACEAQCFATGLRAFTCTPVAVDGCSASCSCK